MKNQHEKNKAMGSNEIRFVILVFALFAIATVAVFAIDYGGAYGYYASEEYPIEYSAEAYGATEDNIINIDVDDSGYISVWPPDTTYILVEDRYGNIRVLLPPGIYTEDIELNLPYGWDYRVYDEYEIYFGDYDSNINIDFFIDADGVIDLTAFEGWGGESRLFVVVVIIPPVVDDYYELDIGDVPFEDGYLDEYISENDEYGGYPGDVPQGGHHGDFPVYDYDELNGTIAPEMSGGYIGITPLNSGGREVFFNCLHTVIQPGFSPLLTLSNGTLGDAALAAAAVAIPTRPGFIHMGWDTDPQGLGRSGDPWLTGSTYFDDDVTHVYAVWGVTVHWNGNGVFLTSTGDPGNPATFAPRVIPYGWSFDEAIAFPGPQVNVSFPNPPLRTGGFTFLGWYNQQLGDNLETLPGGAYRFLTNMNVYVSRTLFARWEYTRPVVHLVMFDINDGDVTGGAALQPGTALQPERLYRFALHNRSIADSGLGGNATTGLGASVAAGNALDPAALRDGVDSPPERIRQNIQRPWIPNADPSDTINHIPIGAPGFTTPFYPDSGLVRGTDATPSVIGQMVGGELVAQTARPRGAPLVLATDTWNPTSGAPTLDTVTAANQNVRRYTLEGWWTTPGAWRDNTLVGNSPVIINSQRFVPPAQAAPQTSIVFNHTAAEAITTGSGWATSEFTVHPIGFPTGLARHVPDNQVLAASQHELAGIVSIYTYTCVECVGTCSGVCTYDYVAMNSSMTVYANWVYRVHFNPNFNSPTAANWGPSPANQGFSLEGTANWQVPANITASNHQLRQIQYRDILPDAPVRTINAAGRRVRRDSANIPAAGGQLRAHQPVAAGMPPDMNRANWTFMGWWDRPVPDREWPIGSSLQPLYPTTNPHNAVQFTGDTQVDGSRTVWAHWQRIHTPVPTPIPVQYLYVNFNLNVCENTELACRDTEGQYGLAFWPSHRPYSTADLPVGWVGPYTNPNNRFFLGRQAAGLVSICGNINISPGLREEVTTQNIINAGTHRNPDPALFNPATGMYASAPASATLMAIANVNYSDRYEIEITRRYRSGISIINTTGAGARPVNQRMPRNPVRPGYIFVGWHPDPDRPIIQANSLPYAPWTVNTTLNYAATPNLGVNCANPGTLYAMWAPAFDMIFNGNGHTATNPATNPLRQEFYRTFPIGFTHAEIMNQPNRWPQQDTNTTTEVGMTWWVWQSLDWGNFPGTFSRNQFTSLTGSLQQGVTGTATAFNHVQNPTHDNGQQYVAGTRFTQAWIDEWSSFRDPVNEHFPYVRVYNQWGITLTFNHNHGHISAGGIPVGTANRSVTQLRENGTFESTLFPPNYPSPPGGMARHPHQPHRGVLYSTAWPGNAPSLVNPEGAPNPRGGWPRDTIPNAVGVRTNVSHGDWWDLFSNPRDADRTFLGWNLAADGSGAWFYPDTPISGPGSPWTLPTQVRNVFAVWGQFIVFDPGLGGAAVQMHPAYFDATGNLNWPITIPGYLPTNHLGALPGEAIWPGLQWSGWYPVPNPRQPGIPPHLTQSLNPAAELHTARRYYAVFTAGVTFHPGQPGTGAFIPHPTLPGDIIPPGGSFDRVHSAGGSVNPPGNELPGQPATGVPPERSGNWVTNGNWVAVQLDQNGDPILVNGRMVPIVYAGCIVSNRRIYHPTNNAPGQTTPRGITGRTVLMHEWRASITFHPGHARGRLDGGTSTITRTFAEDTTLMQNPADQRIPVVTQVLYPAGGDPGLHFGGWRRVNAAGAPLNADGTLVAPGAPLPPLWQNTDIEALVANHYEFFFQAVWSLNLEFFKTSTDTVATDVHPFARVPLEGAGFVLDRWLPVQGGAPGEHSWQQIIPPVAPLPAPQYLVTGVDGRLHIGGTAFDPLLELPFNAAANDLFRLREVVAPARHRLPLHGNWVISKPNAVTMPTYAVNGAVPTPITVIVPDTGGALEGRRLLITNVPYEFDFWKINANNVRLAGARFVLLRYNGTTTPPAVFVTQDMIGPAANQWTVVSTHESTALTAMAMRIYPDAYFQLHETVPPPGHAAPLGQWRLRAISADYPTTQHASLQITPIQPAFLPSIAPCLTYDETYLIMNHPDFELPLTGGTGSGMLGVVVAGTMMILLAMCGAIFVVDRKRRRLIAAE